MSMKRALALAAGFVLVVVIVLLHTPAKDWLWTHPWWHSFIVAVPTLALAIIALIELKHSEDANVLRDEANELRRQTILLTEQLGIEQNKNLQRIAENTTRSTTQAERHAAVLCKYLGQPASVSLKGGTWWGTLQIVEVKDDIVTLFAPGSQGSSAVCTMVHCGELEVVEIPHGSCPVRIQVLKRYGPDIPLGEITKWADRNQPAAAVPVFQRAANAARHATYAKAGSPETRGLYVYEANDGSNLFELEAKPGGTFRGDNVDISKRFMALQVEYEADGFTHSGSGSGGSKHRLFIKTNG